MKREHFETSYQGQAPWDIDGPQPDIIRLAEAGLIAGSVLDAGCGTGENAIYLAGRGHDVLGIDYVAAAIERASAKAAARGSKARFQVGNALELNRLGAQFDTVIDSGLFHTFGDDERAVYVAGLARVVRGGGRFHMLIFSDQEPPGEGPRRVTEREIRDAFRDGWTIESIRASKFETAVYPGAPRFSPDGPRSWVVSVARDQRLGPATP
jgi:SAM-dependent methyltransferase